jgi:hypothetical protein
MTEEVVAIITVAIAVMALVAHAMESVGNMP